MKSLRRADHSSRWVLPTVVRRCVWSRNLVNEEALAHWGGCRAKNKTKKFPQNYDKIVSVPLRPNHSKECTICNLYGWRFRSLSRTQRTLLSDTPHAFACLLAGRPGLRPTEANTRVMFSGVRTEDGKVTFYTRQSLLHATTLLIDGLQLERELHVDSFHDKIRSESPQRTTSEQTVPQHKFCNSPSLMSTNFEGHCFSTPWYPSGEACN